MINRLPNKVAEYLGDQEICCIICGEPFGWGDTSAEYDCVWADELYGLMHEGCAEQGIAKMEARRDCEVCVRNGAVDCPGRWGNCFESRYL